MIIAEGQKKKKMRGFFIAKIVVFFEKKFPLFVIS